MGRLRFYVSSKLYSLGYYCFWLPILWFGLGNIIAGLHCGNNTVVVTLAIPAIYMAALGVVAVFLPAGIIR